MIELSFALGRPLHELAEMPEEDLQLYAHYAAAHPLPHRRLELQLAQLALMVHGAMGGKGSPSLQDFMFHAPADGAVDTVETIPEDDVAAIFGFNPQ